MKRRSSASHRRQGESETSDRQASHKVQANANGASQSQ